MPTGWRCMAPRTKKPEAEDKPADKKPSGWEQFDFLNVELDKEQKEKLRALPLWNEEFDQMLLTVIKAGFQVSLKVDGFNKCYAAYMQIRLHSHPCYGLILAGRGSTPLKAIRQLLYKHFEVLGEVWNATEAPEFGEYDD